MPQVRSVTGVSPSTDIAVPLQNKKKERSRVFVLADKIAAIFKKRILPFFTHLAYVVTSPFLERRFVPQKKPVTPVAKTAVKKAQQLLSSPAKPPAPEPKMLSPKVQKQVEKPVEKQPHIQTPPPKLLAAPVGAASPPVHLPKQAASRTNPHLDS